MGKPGYWRLDIVSERLLALARLAFGELPARPRLTRPQWAALHYFSRANRFSRTTTAFANYVATSPSTISGTVDLLVRKRYLKRRPDTTDRRKTHLELTDKAWKALLVEPTTVLQLVLDRLTDSELRALGASLEDVTEGVARIQSRPLFGVCFECRNFNSRQGQNGGGHCRLFDADIAPEDADGLCVSYRRR